MNFIALNQSSTPKRKFLVKRQNASQQKTFQNQSIFSKKTLEGQINTCDSFNCFSYRNPFAKQQTLASEAVLNNYHSLQTLEDSFTSNHTSISRKVRSGFTAPLPKLSHGQLPSAESVQANETLQHKRTPKIVKKMTEHAADPFYLKQMLNAQGRVQRKHNNYKKIWAQKFMARRRDISLVERSLEKADKNIQCIQVDVQKRKNPTSLEDLVRDNAKDKTFVELGTLRSDLPGLKGKGSLGGKGLCEEIYIIEEVLKFQRGKGNKQRKRGWVVA